MNDVANQRFYEWEIREFPNGDSPFSDYDRALFITAWCLGYEESKKGVTNE